MAKLTIRDIDVEDKAVLVRVDYNVPIKADGSVGDKMRIESSLPTLKYLLERGCRLVLASHLGRPDGRPDPRYSLRPVAEVLASLLDRPVKFSEAVIGPEAQAAVSALETGEVLLLENVRYHPAEEAGDDDFARQLAALADAFVNDAFAVIHRDHASVSKVAAYLPSAIGLLVEKELDTINNVLKSPQHPLLAVIGGSKISTKIDVLKNLLKRVDALLIGGAMANTFLVANGFSVGRSLYEKDQLDVARAIQAAAAEKGAKLFLPTRVVVSESAERPENVRTVAVADVGQDDVIVDVGIQPVEDALDVIKDGGSVIWNGPLGITEIADFSAGTTALAQGLRGAKAFTLVGGGDTAGFLDEKGWSGDFDFVSTGGGAALSLMAGKPLPGLEAIKDK